MNMPKSRDIQAKMPSPKVILHAYWHVTVKVLNSYVYIILMLRREVRSVSFESKRYGSYFFMQATSQSPCLHETLATAAIT